MLSGPIFPLMVKLTIPILLSRLMAWAFNAADMMVVGKFVSDSALAAVSSANAPFAFVTGFLVNMGVGASVACAHAFGSKDEKRIEKAVHTSLLFGVITGIVETVIGLVISDYMLDIVMVPDNIVASTSLYLKISFAASVLRRIHQYTTIVLQVKGDVKRPALYVIISGALNVVLNLFFVLVLHLDVAGVALATLISTGIASILSIRALMQDTGAAHLDIKKLRIDIRTFLDILRIGVPASLRGLFFNITSIITDAAINSFNNAAIISGHGAGGNIESFIRDFLMAINSAAIVIIGQNYGAKNYKRITKTLFYDILAISAMGLLLSGAATVFADKLLLAYITSPEAIAFGATRMLFITLFCFFDVIVDAFTGFMQTCKYSLIPTLISLFAICVFRTAWVFTVFEKYHTYEILLACYPLSYVLSVSSLAIVNIFILRKVKRKFANNNELAL